MKAKLDPTCVIGDDGKGLFLVSGRLYGADDDDAYLVRARSSIDAMDVFLAEIDVPQGDNGDFLMEEEGEPTHFIVTIDYVGELE
jgi:hypothetical protein